MARRMIGFSGVLLVLGALAMTLPGCGDSGAGGGAGGEAPGTKIAPPVNPVPGSEVPEKNK